MNIIDIIDIWLLNTNIQWEMRRNARENYYLQMYCVFLVNDIEVSDITGAINPYRFL